MPQKDVSLFVHFFVFRIILLIARRLFNREFTQEYDRIRRT